MELNKEERIDDLELNGLKIIQKKDWFCFGIDSVLLADFAKDIPQNSSILDLGAGNGILGLLLSAKIEHAKIMGVEVQEEVAKMAKRSIELNHLEDRLKLQICNIKELEETTKYDAVITNPPYKAYGTGLQNISETKLIARHEVLATLEDFIQKANKCLKDKGAMYMVHRPERLVDILAFSRKYKLEPKDLRLVHSKIGEKPTLVLIKAIKNAKPYLKVREPLYIYQEDGTYTKEILNIYGKDRG